MNPESVRTLKLFPDLQFTNFEISFKEQDWFLMQKKCGRPVTIMTEDKD